MPALEGRDLIARAKTGTGKTLAFGIPIIKSLSEDDGKTTSQRYSLLCLHMKSPILISCSHVSFLSLYV